MVNYRGPQWLRPLAEYFEAPYFNRVERLEYRVGHVNQAQLQAEDIHKLRHLETVTVEKLRNVGDDEVKEATTLVPPCRLAGTSRDANKVTLDIKPPGLLLCESTPKK